MYKLYNTDIACFYFASDVLYSGYSVSFNMFIQYVYPNRMQFSKADILWECYE